MGAGGCQGVEESTRTENPRKSMEHCGHETDTRPVQRTNLPTPPATRQSAYLATSLPPRHSNYVHPHSTSVLRPRPFPKILFAKGVLTTGEQYAKLTRAGSPPIHSPPDRASDPPLEVASCSPCERYLKLITLCLHFTNIHDRLFLKLALFHQKSHPRPPCFPKFSAEADQTT